VASEAIVYATGANVPDMPVRMMKTSTKYEVPVIVCEKMVNGS
jgi:hypothetical protein